MVFDANKRKVWTRVSTGPYPKGLLIAPDGKRAYVSQMQSGRVAEVDVESARLVRQFQVGDSPEGLALTGVGGGTAAR